MPESTPQPDARRQDSYPGAVIRSVGIAIAGMVLMLGFTVYTVAKRTSAEPAWAAAATPIESQLVGPPLVGLVR